jgi:hypothetical protein
MCRTRLTPSVRSMEYRKARSGPAITIAALAVAVALSASGGAVAGSLITGKQVKDGSLTGKDVKDGSLGTPDLATGTRTDLTGPAGAPGANGLNGVSGYQALSGSSNTASTGGGAIVIINCTTGKVPIGYAARWDLGNYHDSIETDPVGTTNGLRFLSKNTGASPDHIDAVLYCIKAS